MEAKGMGRYKRMAICLPFEVTKTLWKAGVGNKERKKN